MARLSLFACVLLVGCGTGSGQIVLDPEDTAAPPSDPGVVDSRAGCTRELSFVDEVDGDTDYTATTTWDERVDDEGAWYVTSHIFSSAWGDSEESSTTYDDRLCILEHSQLLDVGGDDRGEQASWTCDADGWHTEGETEIWTGSSWEDYASYQYTNTTDDDGRLIERSWEVDYAYEEDDLRFEQWEYEGELLMHYAQFIGEERLSYYEVVYDYGDDDLYDEISLYLGAYFGAEGELYSIHSFTWDERGNMLTRDIEEIYAGGSIQRTWTYDELDRVETYEYWSNADQVHSFYEATWDPDHYRHLTYAYTDMADGQGDYTSTSTYDGPWPWTATVERDYVDPDIPDGTFTVATTCP